MAVPKEILELTARFERNTADGAGTPACSANSVVRIAARCGDEFAGRPVYTTERGLSDGRCHRRPPCPGMPTTEGRSK